MIKQFLGNFTGDGFQARSLRGGAFTVFQFGAQNAIRLASNLILTRILFPEAFGLMALITVLMTGAAGRFGRRAASICLVAASILLPGGFFAGGFDIKDGDPGYGIFVVPLGAFALFFAVLMTAFGMRGIPVEDKTASPAADSQ